MARRRAPTLRGYSLDSSRIQQDWETNSAPPRPRRHARLHAAPLRRPHHVGSPYDKDNAEWIAPKPKSGASTPPSKLRRPLPHSQRATPRNDRATRYLAKIAEPPVSIDPTSNQQNEQPPRLQRLLHRWRRYRAHGLRQLRNPRRLRGASTASASPSRAPSYRALRRSWRGIKPKVAAEHGASAA